MGKISILASLWLLSGIAAAAPQLPKKPAAPASPRAAVLAQPAKPRQSDAQIEAAIRAKFAKSKSANKFTVHVQGGIATIEGKTDVVQHKGVATRMAKSGGALAVNNRVEVSEAAKKKASDNLEQGRRRVQVKRGDSRSQTNR